MQRSFILALAASLAWFGSGCARHQRSAAQPAAEGQKIFTAMQRAIAAAGKKAEPSLALVKLDREAAPTRTMSGGTIILSGGGSEPTTLIGVLLTRQGHLLVPSVIKPDQDSRLTVLVGENEYVARAIKADETLGMSILKLDADEPFVPLDITGGVDLAAGEWAIVLRPTDEDSDYQKLSTPVACQGEKAGRYRRFLLAQSAGLYPGALVVNLSGQVAGLVDRGSVLAIKDLQADLQRLVTEAAGGGTPEDDRKKRGWLGAMFEPINKDLARARKLSPSSLVVLHVVKDGPAGAAGLREGDLIVALNGKPLRFTGPRAIEDFSKSLQPRAGQKFTFGILREEKALELAGTFTKAPEAETLRAEDLGVTVSSIAAADVFAQNLPTDRGVLVTDVVRGSPAANSGTLRQTLLSRRDIIVELAGRPTPTVAAFSQVLEAIRRDRPPVVLVKYYRGLLTGYAGLNMTLGEKDQSNKQ